MYTKEEVAKFLKESVEWLIEEDMGCTTLELDDRLAICVGWLPGYGEEHRDDCIQSNEEPDFAINAGIKVYTSDDMRTDYEFINMPYYENGEVVMTDCSIEPNEDYDKLAEYFLNEYENIKDLEIDEDGLIIETKEEVTEEFLSDTEVKKLVSNVKDACDAWLKEVEALGNQTAYSDRMVEEILEKSKELEASFKKQFDESLKESSGKFVIYSKEKKPLQIYDTEEEAEEAMSEFECSDCYIKKVSDSEADYIENDITDLVKEEVTVNEEFDDMKSLAEDLFKHFEDLKVYYEIWPEDDGINVEIEWGDWKHDHLWCDYEVEHFLESRGYTVTGGSTEVTDEDGSDTYSAIHYYTVAKK